MIRSATVNLINVPMVPSGPPQRLCPGTLKTSDEDDRADLPLSPCEFLDPPGRLGNKHGDGPGVPSRSHTKQDECFQLYLGREIIFSFDHILSRSEGDVRHSVASDHIVAEHVRTVNTQHQLRPWKMRG